MKLWIVLLIGLLSAGCLSQNKPSDTSSVAVINEAHGYAENYTPERLTDLKESGKRFAVFVGADWCPGCKRLTKEIHANQNVLPKDTVILTANFDNELELRREYGVAVKHSAIYFDETGNHLKTESGVIFKDFMNHLANLNQS